MDTPKFTLSKTASKCLLHCTRVRLFNNATNGERKNTVVVYLVVKNVNYPTLTILQTSLRV